MVWAPLMQWSGQRIQPNSWQKNCSSLGHLLSMVVYRYHLLLRQSQGSASRLRLCRCVAYEKMAPWQSQLNFKSCQK